jgi:hypothetical protein
MDSHDFKHLSGCSVGRNEHCTFSKMFSDLFLKAERTSYKKMPLIISGSPSRISRSANPHCDFVIASQGEIASFPAGTTAFFLEIESTRGVPCKKSPARSMMQLTSSTPTLCRSATPWSTYKKLKKFTKSKMADFAKILEIRSISGHAFCSFIDALLHAENVCERNRNYLNIS